MKKKLLLFILNLICFCIFAGGYEDSKTIDANYMQGQTSIFSDSMKHRDNHP